jgi:hypothetical protein
MDGIFLAYLARRKYDIYVSLSIGEQQPVGKPTDSSFAKKEGAYEELGKVIDKLPADYKKIVNDLFEALKDIEQRKEEEKSCE